MFLPLGMPAWQSLTPEIVGGPLLGPGPAMLLGSVAVDAVSRLISWGTFRSATLRTWFEGTPTVLVQSGKVIQANLDRELLTQGELVNLLRKQGVETVAEVHIAVLAPDGNLPVARHSGEVSPPPGSGGSAESAA